MEEGLILPWLLVSRLLPYLAAVDAVDVDTVDAAPVAATPMPAASVVAAAPMAATPVVAAPMATASMTAPFVQFFLLMVIRRRANNY
jgi:hypothetical protein